MEKRLEHLRNFEISLPHGSAHHKGMARRGERVERSSGAAPPPQSGTSDRSPGEMLQVRIQDSANGRSTVVITGELDLSTIGAMEAPLFEQLRQRSAVLVDLSRVTFIDSSGIGILISAARDSNGTRMNVLIGPGTQVERVFRIAGVGEALSVFSDRDQALAALD
jgi:anti-sigma B factor antagonist